MRNSSRPCFLALDGGSRGLRLAAPGFGQRCWGLIEVGGRRDGRCLVPPPSVMLQLWAEPFPQGSSGHALAGLSVTLRVGSLCRLLAVKSFLGPLSSLGLQISVKHKFLSWIMMVEGAGRCSPSRGGPEQYLGNAFCWGPVVTCPHGPHRREASYGKNSTLELSFAGLPCDKCLLLFLQDSLPGHPVEWCLAGTLKEAGKGILERLSPPWDHRTFSSRIQS